MTLSFPSCTRSLFIVEEPLVVEVVLVAHAMEDVELRLRERRLPGELLHHVVQEVRLPGRDVDVHAVEGGHELELPLDRLGDRALDVLERVLVFVDHQNTCWILTTASIARSRSSPAGIETRSTIVCPQVPFRPIRRIARFGGTSSTIVRPDASNIFASIHSRTRIPSFPERS